MSNENIGWIKDADNDEYSFLVERESTSFLCLIQPSSNNKWHYKILRNGHTQTNGTAWDLSIAKSLCESYVAREDIYEVASMIELQKLNEGIGFRIAQLQDHARFMLRGHHNEFHLISEDIKRLYASAIKEFNTRIYAIEKKTNGLLNE